MSYLDENKNDPIVNKNGSEIDDGHPKSDKFIPQKKISAKKPGKFYTVTVTYIKLTDEQAKVKLAIVENILKKGNK